MLTIRQYADAIGVSRQYVHRLVRSGKIRAKRIGHGYVVTQRPSRKAIAAKLAREKQT